MSLRVGGLAWVQLVTLFAASVSAAQPAAKMTRETATGEWAGIAQVAPGSIHLFYLEIPETGAATLAEVQSRGAQQIILYEIGDFAVTDGRVRVFARELKWNGLKPGDLTILGDGCGRQDFGWMNLSVSGGAGSNEFVRLVKTPGDLFRLIPAMLRAGRRAVADSRGGRHRLVRQR
jgi:hypothetical protein